MLFYNKYESYETAKLNLTAKIKEMKKEVINCLIYFLGRSFFNL